MLIQTAVPRTHLDLSRYPKYIHVHTLSKPGVSEGEVFFSGTKDPTIGEKAVRRLDPSTVYPLEDGMEAYGYILPFWELFQAEPKKRGALTKRARELNPGAIVAVNGRQLAKYATAGFHVTAKSAFRASTREYEERVVLFSLFAPVTGGGIIRLGDCLFDVSNPTFDYYAKEPTKLKPDPDLQISYERTHKPLDSAKAKVRDQRILEAEASMAREAVRTQKDYPLLPE